jgi:hypothetical protein
VQKIEGRLWGYYYDAVTKANYTFMVPPRTARRRSSLIGRPGLERSRGLAKNNGISLRSYAGKLHSFIIADVLPQARNWSAPTWC